MVKVSHGWGHGGLRQRAFSAILLLRAPGLVCIEDSCPSGATSPLPPYSSFSLSQPQPPLKAGGYAGCLGHAAFEQPSRNNQKSDHWLSTLLLTCPSIRVSICEMEIITRPTSQEGCRNERGPEGNALCREPREGISHWGPPPFLTHLLPPPVEGLARPRPILSPSLQLCDSRQVYIHYLYISLLTRKVERRNGTVPQAKVDSWKAHPLKPSFYRNGCFPGL